MLLLTGATGLVGSELLPRLTGPVVPLKRPEADVTQPRLGLAPARYSELQEQVTAILHCAADTRFHLPLEDACAVNTEGTRRLVEFARGCRRLEKFGYVSTVFVAGLTPGRIPEAPLARPAAFCNTYQQSKYEAEQVVLEAGLPAAVFRLSSILGDSGTGEIRRFTYVHQLIRLLPRNVLPVAPCDPAAPLDLIPTDWAADALARLFERCFMPGRVHHICAGPQSSLTARELLDLTVSELDGAVRVPELVSLEEYQEYVEKSRRSGDRLLNELLRVLGYFLPHLGLYQAFERNADLGDPPPVRGYYPKVVRYCLRLL
jgi:nucleoside-diphosphate-sugar epimerase